MSTEDFKHVLWEQDRDGTWYLLSHSKTRALVERVAQLTSNDSTWRFVSQEYGVLAESIHRP
jgi:hypothetical protein